MESGICRREIDGFPHFIPTLLLADYLKAAKAGEVLYLPAKSSDPRYALKRKPSRRGGKVFVPPPEMDWELMDLHMRAGPLKEAFSLEIAERSLASLWGDPEAPYTPDPPH